MTENTTIPGMANGPCEQEPIVPWRKSSRSQAAGACVEVMVAGRG